MAFNSVQLFSYTRRLGSNMDMSPAVNAAINRFGPRLSLNLNRNAIALYKYRLEEASRSGVQVRDLDRDERWRAEEFSSAMPVGLVPLADDINSATAACEIIEQIYSRSWGLYGGGKAVKIGTDRTQSALDDYNNSLEDSNEFSDEFFNIVLPTFNAGIPAPLVLNMYADLVELVSKTDDPDHGPLVRTKERAPMIWTSSKEVESAERFFKDNILDRQRTVAMHLTAGTYRVFNEIWPRNNFMSLARHLISRGYSIVLVFGGLKKALEQDAHDCAVHNDFLKDIGTKQAFIFNGDILTQAEIIRRCSLFISAETGPAHVASAVGTPKITIANSKKQAELWMMTHITDKGFVKEGHGENISAPTVGEVIEAAERTLQK